MVKEISVYRKGRVRLGKFRVGEFEKGSNATLTAKVREGLSGGRGCVCVKQSPSIVGGKGGTRVTLPS